MLDEWKYLIAGFLILDFLTVYLVIRYLRKRSKKNATQSPTLSSPGSSAEIKVNPLDHSSTLAYQEKFIFQGRSREEIFRFINNPKDYPKWRKGLKKVNILSSNPLAYEEMDGENIVINFQETQNQSPKLVIRIGKNSYLPAPMEIKFEGQQIQNSRTQKYDTTLIIAANITLAVLAKNAVIQQSAHWMFQKALKHWVKNFGEGLQEFLREGQN